MAKISNEDFPGRTVDSNLPAYAWGTGSIPGLEDSTCRRQLNPKGHNYWAQALEPALEQKPL